MDPLDVCLVINMIIRIRNDSKNMLKINIRNVPCIFFLIKNNLRYYFY